MRPETAMASPSMTPTMSEGGSSGGGAARRREVPMSSIAPDASAKRIGGGTKNLCGRVMLISGRDDKCRSLQTLNRRRQRQAALRKVTSSILYDDGVTERSERFSASSRTRAGAGTGRLALRRETA